MIDIALPKGRLGEKVYEILAQAGYPCPAIQEENRKLDACSGGEREELFFRMWSIKEAYVKLTGRGLSGGLSGFEIDWNEGRVLEGEKCAAYFREQQKTEGYAFCVCTGEALRDILWKETGI